ncbi:MAG: hypothetical protein C0183_08645 [Roseiflexus castenholzii]|nr:MAG: hypothetical protein C0183_08645 [Roseiflexus castenholzii]
MDSGICEVAVIDGGAPAPKRCWSPTKHRRTTYCNQIFERPPPALDHGLLTACTAATAPINVENGVALPNDPDTDP